MDKGILQQVSAPNEIYGKPHNTFIAGFIGTPQMNMANVTPCGDNCLAFGDTTFAFPAPLPVKTNSILGIRPEKLTIAPAHTPAGLSGVIEYMEYLGNEIISHVKLAPGITWYVRGAVEGIKVGDRVGLKFSSNDTHWFDPTTTTRIAF